MDTTETTTETMVEGREYEYLDTRTENSYKNFGRKDLPMQLKYEYRFGEKHTNIWMF